MTAPEVDPAAVEAAARMLYLADYETGREQGFDQTTDEMRGYYRQTALAILTAAYPLLREGIAAEVRAEIVHAIEAEADRPDGKYMSAFDAMSRAANIACQSTATRGEK